MVINTEFTFVALTVSVPEQKVALLSCKEQLTGGSLWFTAKIMGNNNTTGNQNTCSVYNIAYTYNIIRIL